MKTIKITLAACLVTLSAAFIWTGCQKEKVNSTIHESITDTKKGVPDDVKTRKFSIESLSKHNNKVIKTDIIDNGKGRVVVNSVFGNFLNTTESKLFIVDLPVVKESNYVKYNIPEGQKFWLIDVDNEDPLAQRISGAGKFHCECTSTGCTTSSTNPENSSGCFVQTINQKGTTKLECSNSGCTSCCSGFNIVANLYGQAGLSNSTIIKTASGQIILKAEKLILNGKLFQ